MNNNLREPSFDYRKFYSREDYLFDEVGPLFIRTGNIDPVNFYLILIWKAERAKNYHKKRLAAKAGSFPKAVTKISLSLYKSDTSKRRLEILMENWGFRLSTATAILAVLYPTEFTIYDRRVCEELKKFQELAYRGFSDNLWTEYQLFKGAVEAESPEGFSLRDKDRYLWGRSAYKGAKDESY